MADRTGKSTKSKKSPVKRSKVNQSETSHHANGHHDRNMTERDVEVEHLKTTLIAVNQKVEIIEEVQVEIKNTRSHLDESEGQRKQLQDDILKMSEEVRAASREHQNEQNKMLVRQQELQDDLRKKQQDMDQQQRDNTQAQNKLKAEHERERENMQQQFHQEKQRMENEREELRKSMQQQIDALRNEKDQELAQLQQAKQESEAALQREIDEQRVEIKRKREEILSLESQVLELNQKLRVKEDVENQCKMLQQQVKELQSGKDSLQKELETASDYIVSLEEKVYKANKTSLELLKQLKDAEVEIETLKNYIIELKQRIAVYIPVKDDPVDRKLAEFINNYPERNKLKIMFMRESDGVYQFGTKRVAVRVDKDKINIRVGGGYLSIDEFLDQYTPAELEKLERKDPLKKFSEKVAVQKTIVDKGVREGSPVRSPGRK